MAKGGQYEREICKKLSIWWSDGKDDDLFWRSSGSGGRATVRGRKGQTTRNHCGDITNTDHVGQSLIKLITLECKRGYSKHTISDLLDCPEKSALQEYEKFFDQAETSRVNAGSFAWGVIVKRDQRDAIFFIPSYLWSEVSKFGEIMGPFLYLEAFLRRKEGQNIVQQEIIGMKLEHFLQGVKPSQIIELSAKIGWEKSKDENVQVVS